MKQKQKEMQNEKETEGTWHPIFEQGKYALYHKNLNIKLEESYNPPLIDSPPATHKVAKIEDNIQAVVDSDNLLDGQYLIFHSEGQLKGELYYKKGRKHGPCRYWNPEGSLLAISYFWHSMQEGLLLWYYPSGIVYSRQLFKKGVWHGEQLFYTEEGKLKSSLNYTKGALNGIITIYQPDGSIARTATYKCGKLE